MEKEDKKKKFILFCSCIGKATESCIYIINQIWLWFTITRTKNLPAEVLFSPAWLYPPRIVYQ